MTETASYVAENQLKSVRQVVLEVTRPRLVASRFGKLMLGEPYRTLTASFWAVDFFRLEGDPGPYLLLRADGHTTRLRNKPFRVAFCFYQMKAGGLFALFVDFPGLRIPRASSVPFALFEIIRGLDLDDERQRISEAIERPRLHICFAEGEGPGDGLGSGLWRDGAIDALYDVLVDLDPQCREALKREWQSLLDHHHTLASERRDFNASVRQMQSQNPLTQNPILGRPGAPEAGPAGSSPSGGD